MIRNSIIYIIGVILGLASVGCDNQTRRDERFACGNIELGHIRTTVDDPATVRVVFSARDCLGAAIDEVTREHVEVFADGAEITSTGAPEPAITNDVPSDRKTLILIDASNSSFNDNSFEQLLTTSRSTAQGLSEAGHNIGIAFFGGPTHFSVAQSFTLSQEELNAALDPNGTIAPTEGLGTRDLYGAIVESVNILDDVFSENGILFRSLIVLTSGRDQAMTRSQDNMVSYIEQVSSQGIEFLLASTPVDLETQELLEGLNISNTVIATAEAPLENSASSIAETIQDTFDGVYMVVACSPRVGGSRELTITVMISGTSGSITTSYNADNFDMAGCNPSELLSPCGERECGFAGDIRCGTCPEERPYCGAGWVCTDNPSCPDDMVLLPTRSACIDRYEASRGPNERAESVYGELPWDQVDFDEAQSACERAQKRLCTYEEWVVACRGPEYTPFPYGPDYQDEVCNGSSSGFDGAIHTGYLEECEGGYSGLFDMLGNVAEWIDACSEKSCQVMGGSYFDTGTTTQCLTSVYASPNLDDPSRGFRCCMTIEGDPIESDGDADVDADVDADSDSDTDADADTPEEECNGLDDDGDGVPDNGFDCIQNSTVSCTTTCDSIGTGTCSATCEIPAPEDCIPPDEICGNGLDDDCDGAIDPALEVMSTTSGIEEERSTGRFSMAWTGEELAVVWTAKRAAHGRIHFQRFELDGTRLGKNQIISSGDINYHPQIVWNGSGFGVSWGQTESPGTRYIFSTYDEDGSLSTVDGYRISSFRDTDVLPILSYIGPEYLALYKRTSGLDPVSKIELKLFSREEDTLHSADVSHLFDSREMIWGFQSIWTGEELLVNLIYSWKGDNPRTIYLYRSDDTFEPRYSSRILDTGDNFSMLGMSHNGSLLGVINPNGQSSGNRIDFHTMSGDDYDIVETFTLVESMEPLGNPNMVSEGSDFVAAWVDPTLAEGEISIARIDETGDHEQLLTIPSERVLMSPQIQMLRINTNEYVIAWPYETEVDSPANISFAHLQGCLE